MEIVRRNLWRPCLTSHTSGGCGQTRPLISRRSSAPSEKYILCSRSGVHQTRQDDCSYLALESAAELLQESRYKKGTRSQPWRLSLNSFTLHIVDGGELFASGNLVLIDEQRIFQYKLMPITNLHSYLHFPAPEKTGPTR